jgi:hypothetical protein
MGLDMYLSAQKHISKIDWDKAERTSIESAIRPEWQDVVDAADLNSIASDDVQGCAVKVLAAYWRKANQIHKWFVDNVQGGKDNCHTYHVSHEKLKRLLATVEVVLEEGDASLLPPAEGFFFGGTEVDDYYWHQLERTKKELARIIENPDFENLQFDYQSSW